MLKQKINDTTAVIGILGLGHVGYPMSSLFAKNGFTTVGYDINPTRLKDIQSGKVVSELDGILPVNKKKRKEKLAEIEKNLNLTNEEENLKNADVFLIDVPTPLKENETPNLVFLENTCKTICKFLNSKGTLVIVESTIYPGATQEIVKPLLEESGLCAGTDFYLSFSPERIDPGNKKWGLEKIPKIVGRYK